MGQEAAVVSGAAREEEGRWERAGWASRAAASVASMATATATGAWALAKVPQEPATAEAVLMGKQVAHSNAHFPARPRPESDLMQSLEHGGEKHHYGAGL